MTTQPSWLFYFLLHNWRCWRRNKSSHCSGYLHCLFM